MIARDRDTDNNGSLEQRFYPTHDANFNVGALFNSTGAVVERYTYDPFGTATILNATFGVIAASTNAWKYLHQGGRFNAESGFYSFRYREYSPTLGRWVTMDPIGYESNDVHLYRYVNSNPFYSLDPTGELKLNPAIISLWPYIRVFFISQGIIQVAGNVIGRSVVSSNADTTDQSVSTPLPSHAKFKCNCIKEDEEWGHEPSAQFGIGPFSNGIRVGINAKCDKAKGLLSIKTEPYAWVNIAGTSSIHNITITEEEGCCATISNQYTVTKWPRKVAGTVYAEFCCGKGFTKPLRFK